MARPQQVQQALVHLPGGWDSRGCKYGVCPSIILRRSSDADAMAGRAKPLGHDETGASKSTLSVGEGSLGYLLTRARPGRLPCGEFTQH